MGHKIIALMTLCLMSLGALGQSIQVKAPSTCTKGQAFKVTFDINGEAKGFKAPNWGNLEVVSGPSQSHSYSEQWVNGKHSSSTRMTMSYLVRANQEGTFNVGAASCSVDGHQISSQPFTVKCVKGSAAQQQPQPQQNSLGRGNQGPQPTRQQQQQQSRNANVDKSELYARASVSKSNPYVGEQVIATYKIYSRVDLEQVDYGKAPEKKGFWVEDLTGNGKVRVSQETVNGKLYNVYVIQQEALFPQEAGHLTITPFVMPARAITYPQEPIQTPWGIIGYRQTARLFETKLSTGSLSVNARPLPEGPDNFSGGVGKFSVKGGVDVYEVRANEAITFTLTVSGSGNLMLIDAPEVNFPQVFEVYDPKVDDHISRNGGVSGSRTFEWVLIPRTQGDYEIPAVEFVYFDPQQGKYVTATTAPIKVKVNKGDPRAMRRADKDLAMMNKDINHIKTHGIHLRPSGSCGKVTLLQWILLALTALGTVAGVVTGRRRQELMADEVGMRLRRAMKVARRRLRNAEKHLHDGNDELFYEEIYKALWGCLSDKYSIELRQLSRETVEERLQEKHIAPEKHDLIMNTLNDIDMARFAPGDSSSRKQAIYDEALQTIVEL